MKTMIYKDWLQLSQCAYSDTTQKCFESVVMYYTQDNRYYHTLDHVQDLFSQIKKAELSDPEKGLLAHVSLFHDVIYDSNSKLNEVKSAQFAVTWLKKLAIPKPVQIQIETIIIDTATHISNDSLTQLFFDMDLAILGASPEVYKQYHKSIRKEYSKIPLQRYKIGRKQFLQHTLNRDHIFTTTHYQSMYEEQARINMKEELNTL